MPLDALSRSRGRSAVVLLASLAGCSGEGSDPVCPARTVDALIQGAEREGYLGLASAETRAIVRVVSRVASNGSLCTGTLIASDWVLTARHCLAIAEPQLIFATDDGEVRVPVVSFVRHPSLDMGLLKLDPSELAGLDVAPVPAADPGDAELVDGERVELAGYGTTEAGTEGTLRFLVEPISHVDTENFVVSGFGASGACFGDSGGPLLVRDPSGVAKVAGVLSAGATSCRGNDRYVRVDGVKSWLVELVTARETPASGCADLGEQGRCLYGVALTCERGQLRAERCSPGTACGWDPRQRGFHCVAPALDPCAGVDSLGACQGGTPIFCEDGRLVRVECGCGDVCRFDGATGGPECRKGPA